MLELKFSSIGVTSTLQQVLDEYCRKNYIHVDVVPLDLESNTVWSEMLNWTLHGGDGKGPDVSHIASTWTPSLTGMNALRPFSPGEVQLAGGEQAFLPHCWQSGLGIEDDKVWSLPLHSFIFLLTYRRDLLEKAGIDEKAAFQNTQSFNETIAKLKGKISETPWVVPVAQKHLGTMHYIASWIWDAGGDFFAPDNCQIAFLEPTALEAICSYFSALRSMALLARPVENDRAADDIFLAGQAAVSITRSFDAYTRQLSDQTNPELREKIGFAPIFGTPWVGGDNIVIWKQACISPVRERAVVALAQHLLSAETQRLIAQSSFTILPSRPDVLSALPAQNTLLTDSVIRSLRTGRSYRPMRIWTKIEYLFTQTFWEIGAEVLAGADVNVTVRKHLEACARALELLMA